LLLNKRGICAGLLEEGNGGFGWTGHGADLGGRAGLAGDANHAAAAVELGSGGDGQQRLLQIWAGVLGFGGLLS
jgi:hypothetical protein